jgi:hypothetical protein
MPENGVSGTDERLEAALRKLAPPVGLFLTGLLLMFIGVAVDSDLLRGLGAIGLLGGVAWAILSHYPSTGRVATAAPVSFSSIPVPPEVRQQRLQEHLSHEIAYSLGRVESVTPYTAVVVSGKPVNHILHLLVSVLMCGFWIPIWILVTISGGEKRHVLTVDPYGNVARR